MNITDINFAIEILSHPQSGDESDINMALNIAIESLKTSREVLNQEPCDVAKAFQFGLAFGFGEKYDEMDRIINEVIKAVTPAMSGSGDTTIPYLMHKEMGIPISECKKAYDIAIDYLRSQAKVKG